MLADEERARLLAWAREPAARPLALRARIVLACAQGQPDTRVAADLGVARDTVRKWRSRFLAHRLGGLVPSVLAGLGRIAAPAAARFRVPRRVLTARTPGTMGT